MSLCTNVFGADVEELRYIPRCFTEKHVILNITPTLSEHIIITCALQWCFNMYSAEFFRLQIIN